MIDSAHVLAAATRLRILVHVVLIFLSTCSGQTTASAPQPSSDTTLPDQIELARLIDLSAQKLRINIEYDPAALKQTVTLRLSAGMSDQELWILVNRLLASRGMTTVRAAKDSTLSVVKITDAANIVKILPDDLTPLPGDIQPDSGPRSLRSKIDL